MCVRAVSWLWLCCVRGHGCVRACARARARACVCAFVCMRTVLKSSRSADADDAETWLPWSSLSAEYALIASDPSLSTICSPHGPRRNERPAYAYHIVPWPHRIPHCTMCRIAYHIVQCVPTYRIPHSTICRIARHDRQNALCARSDSRAHVRVHAHACARVYACACKCVRTCARVSACVHVFV